MLKLARSAVPLPVSTPALVQASPIRLLPCRLEQAALCARWLCNQYPMDPMEPSGKRLARYLDSPGDAKKAKSSDILLLRKVTITGKWLHIST